MLVTCCQLMGVSAFVAGLILQGTAYAVDSPLVISEAVEQVLVLQYTGGFAGLLCSTGVDTVSACMACERYW